MKNSQPPDNTPDPPKKKRNPFDKEPYIPTPEDIARECALIQEESKDDPRKKRNRQAKSAGPHKVYKNPYRHSRR